MNHRAGGNRNGTLGVSGGGESSDLFDMRALAAASARSAASTPSKRPQPPELSNMAGRRESVVGARVDETASGASRIAWLWTVVGCVSVLGPGLAGVWYLGHAAEGAAGAGGGPAGFIRTAAAASGGPSVEIEPIAHQPMPEPVVAPGHPAAKAVEPAAPSVRADKTPRHRAGEPRRAVVSGQGQEPPAAPGAAPAVVAAAATPEESEPAADKADKAEKADKVDKTEKAEKAAEPAPEEPAIGPPRIIKQLRAALARLQTKVYQCHSRFQVDGTADVRVSVSPSGTVESLSLLGDFEGTPTGDCIVRHLSAASFPSFDGTEPIRISHSFSLE
jgi:hypothetical protein